jgi:hypothetical protein
MLAQFCNPFDLIKQEPMPLAIVVSETHGPLNPDIDITTFRFVLDSISGELVAENGKHIGRNQTRSKKKPENCLLC